MMRVKDFAFVLALVCVVHHFLQVDGVKDTGGRAQPGGKGRRRGQRNETGPKASSGTGVFRGRFPGNDGAQCAWIASGDGDSVVLGVTCTNGEKTFKCEYVGKPNSCQQYSSNTEAYWKQISRSLKKQKSLCHDSRARVKAGMCRSAPEDAHFRLMLTRSSSGVPSPPPGPPPCPGRIDRLNLAEKYCTSSWSSLCTFLFLMLENDECP